MRPETKKEYREKLGDWVWLALQYNPKEWGELQTLPEMIWLLLDDEAWS